MTNVYLRLINKGELTLQQVLDNPRIPQKIKDELQDILG